MRVVATFARRDEHNERTGIKERGLFWEGELAPGRAVKWRVRAPGTEMRIDSDVRGKLGDGLQPAPAEAFWKLVDAARYRVVRLHAASMLAYLGDPRAMEALDRIGPPAGADEERTVARIRRAISSARVCDLGKNETACVFNRQHQRARLARAAGDRRGRQRRPHLAGRRPHPRARGADRAPAAGGQAAPARAPGPRALRPTPQLKLQM